MKIILFIILFLASCNRLSVEELEIINKHVDVCSKNGTSLRIVDIKLIDSGNGFKTEVFCINDISYIFYNNRKELNNE